MRCVGMVQNPRNFDDRNIDLNDPADKLVSVVLHVLDNQINYKQQMGRNADSLTTLFRFVGDVENCKGFIGSILRFNSKTDEMAAAIAAKTASMMSDMLLIGQERERFYQTLIRKIADMQSRANKNESKMLNDTIDLIINGLGGRALAERLAELSLRKSRD